MNRYGEFIQIGNGGNGIVYSAIDTETKNKVVLKYDNNEDPSTYWREMNALNRIANIEGVPKIVDSFVTPYRVIVTEFIENTMDVFDYQNEYSPISEEESSYIIKQLCIILLNIDKVGVQHNDIKDENIIINLNTKNITLIDFGCATLDGARDTTIELGTKVFHPIEYARHKHYDDVKYNMWGLGCLLYRLIYNIDNPSMYEENKIESDNQDKTQIKVSEKCIAFMDACFKLDPQQRQTYEQAIKHDWIRG